MKIFISGWINVWTETIPSNIQVTEFLETGHYKGWLTY